MKKTNRTFVIGDIHGGYKALLQCLQRAKFDYQKDTLISLGDVADGWPEIVECFEELLKIKNLIMVRGNHDQWLLEWFMYGETPDIWTKQGGANTLKSYDGVPDKIKEAHSIYLQSTPFYYIDKKNRLFVHGGVEIGIPVHLQPQTDLMWSRGLWDIWKSTDVPVIVPEYAHVYVGHTSTSKYSDVPITNGNVTFMDTGGGWEGKLSMMNVDTEEVFQSDLVEDLYPGQHSR